ncbi:MAG: MMPL family transporter [Candidatus Cloacimonetes bacterium]|nr:MMPL family transporter [Candidatus Cloacimonadota bacterium]
MRKKIINKIAEYSAKRPGIVLLISLLITIMMIYFATDLKISMQFKDLMPQNHSLVKGFNDIIDNYDSASMIIVAATGEEESLKKFADSIAPRIREKKEYVSRVDYKMNTDFILNHGFMLQKEKDLKNSLDMYSNLNLIPWFSHLNDSFEKTYIDDDESISTKQKENNAVGMLDRIDYLISSMSEFSTGKINNSNSDSDNVAKKFLIGEEYSLAAGKDMILLLVQPNFTVDEIDKVVKAVNMIDSIIEEEMTKYPGLDAGTTGTMALTRDEMVSSQKDMNYTTILALILILILFIISFRMWMAPILAGITMIIGIIWTAGFASIAVGSLNMMTSMFGVIILGLGIDFSIHIISIYTELRADGLLIEDAIKETLVKSGGGIVTGALTTGFAFYTLMISKSVGMFQFGLISGSGVILCMLATMFVLPSMLVLRDKINSKKTKPKKVISTKFLFLGNYSRLISKYPIITLLISFALTIIFIISASKMEFDYNYLNMEPVGLKSIEMQHLLEDKFDMTPDYALVTTSSIEEAQKIAEEARKLKMIGFVSSISDYIPSLEKQEKRALLIDIIRQNLKINKKIKPLSWSDKDFLIEQIERLQDNIIELSQLAFMGGQDKLDTKAETLIGDFEDSSINGSLGRLLLILDSKDKNVLKGVNQFQDGFSTAFKKYSLSMASADIIGLDTIPEDIKNQFISNSGDQYLVSMYPKESVWNLEFLERFKSQMEKLDERITGMPLVFYVLIDIVGQDGAKAAIFAIIIIFLLLLLDFRNFKFALIAMVPLVSGAIWMIGIMQLLGLKLTLLNVMGLPLILGIGVDDGVHILHRYSVEKKGNISRVFTSTGRAVLITSLTTMLAFGSLKFATYRGLGSLGIALFIGVGACFVVTITLLPAILQIMENKNINS